MKIVKNTKKLGWLLLTAFGLSTPAFAAGPPQPSTMENPLVLALLVLMVLLALAIAILANTVNSAASVFRDKMRAQKEEEENKSSGGITATLLITGLLLSISGIAQVKPAADAAQAVVDNTINGLAPMTFYMLMLVLSVEILIIIVLIYQLKWLMGIEKKAVTVEVKEETVKVKSGITAWWNRINKSIAIEKEKDIDLDHDYDGIRELDNTIPPWWRLAFAFTILFAVVYLYRYHVAKSAPLQIEEYQIAMQKGEEEKNAYLKLTASNVDENSVKLLDVAGIDAGKTLFKTNCVACHGPEGQGLVGPNLTDTYWIHGGDIKDVFKTIKYGWPEKGMRSWKEDFSPIQIAQLASFVKSLGGTSPANPKAPEGTLFDDKAGAAKTDSSVAAK
jgi:cytochrome c oxidase cbb3-type subunit 3